MGRRKYAKTDVRRSKKLKHRDKLAGRKNQVPDTSKASNPFEGMAWATTKTPVSKATATATEEEPGPTPDMHEAVAVSPGGNRYRAGRERTDARLGQAERWKVGTPMGEKRKTAEPERLSYDRGVPDSVLLGNGVTNLDQFESWLTRAQVVHGDPIERIECGGKRRRICGGSFFPVATVVEGAGGELSFKMRCSRCADETQYGGAEVDPNHPSIARSIVFSHLMTGVNAFQQYATQLQGLDCQPLSRAAFMRAVEVFRDAAMLVAREEVKVTHEFLGLLKKAIAAAADGSWQKRGTTSSHCVVIVKSIEIEGNPMLEFELISRNDLNNPHLGTSCMMENIGLQRCLIRMREGGLGDLKFKIVLDGDTASHGIVLLIYEHAVVLQCFGHENKNTGKLIVKHGKDKENTELLPGIVCCCRGRKHDWKNKCGCFKAEGEMAAYLKCQMAKLTKLAGTDHEAFQESVMMLHHCVQGVHEVTVGEGEEAKTVQCSHHDVGEVRLRQPKECPLTCPFHIGVVKMLCERRRDLAFLTIDGELGALTTAIVESCFSTLWGTGSMLKDRQLSCVLFEALALVGLLKSNRLGMMTVLGDEYEPWELRLSKELGHAMSPLIANRIKKAHAEAKIDAKKKAKGANTARASSKRANSNRKSWTDIYKHGLSLPDEITGEHAGESGGVAVVDGTVVDASGIDQKRETWKHFVSGEKNGRLLLVLDINELLLYRGWLKKERKYSEAIIRPHLKDFVKWLWAGNIGGWEHIDIALWCGAQSDTQQQELLDLLKPHGLREAPVQTKTKKKKAAVTTTKTRKKNKYLMFVLRSQGRTCQIRLGQRGFEKTKDGKVKVVKPMEFLEESYSSHSHKLLIDNDTYKSEGVPAGGRKKKRKFVNKPEEYLVTVPFKGEADDDGLNTKKGSEGAVVQAITEKLASIKQ